MSGPRAAQSFAIVDAAALTLAPLARRTSDISAVSDEDLGVIARATILVEGGTIRAVGRDVRLPPGIEVVDAGGRVVMPGFVDAHTHALFAGDRVADFEDIAAGRPPKLGIRYTVEQTRRCDLSQLVEIGSKRLALMAEHGTTTAEVKTGYALTAVGEAMMLEAMTRLDATPGIPHIVATFCGAHALPSEFSETDAFVDALCGPILEAVAHTKIARFADAFCEKGFFTPAQSGRFLKACAAKGMRARVHADELSHSGGAALAADLRAASADHLNFADADDIRRLAGAKAVAVLCPATTEYLGLDRYAPARALIDAGVPVALATDFNPGTSPCPSLQTVAHLARRRLHMTTAETIAGITVQAGRSLGLDPGALEAGRTADIVMLDTNDYREIGYYYGANMVTWRTVGRPAGPGRRSTV